MNGSKAHIAGLVAGTLLAFAASMAQAQPIAVPKPDTTLGPGWNLKSRFGLGLSQSSFTSNWAGDEVGTVSWLMSIDTSSENQMHEKFRWLNTLVLGFGQTHQQDKSRTNWLAPVKSADKIDYDSFGRFTLGKFVDPYIALTLDSQFYEERGAFGTKPFSPVQVGEFAGVARAIFDTKRRSMVSRFGFGFRQNINRFHGVDPSVAKRATNDGGFEWKTIGRFTDATERNEWKTDLTLFQAVFFSESDADIAGRWKQTDVRWQNTFSTKLFKAMSLGLYLDYIYDAQSRRAGQLKQTLGVGLNYDLI